MIKDNSSRQDPPSSHDGHQQCKQRDKESDNNARYNIKDFNTDNLPDAASQDRDIMEVVSEYDLDGNHDVELDDIKESDKSFAMLDGKANMDNDRMDGIPQHSTIVMEANGMEEGTDNGNDISAQTMFESQLQPSDSTRKNQDNPFITAQATPKQLSNGTESRVRKILESSQHVTKTNDSQPLLSTPICAQSPG